MLNAINNNTGNHGKVVAYTDRKAALKTPIMLSTRCRSAATSPAVIDFEVPKNMG